MPEKTLIGGFIFTVCILMGTAMAHHGASEYDRSVVQRFEGVVIEHRWKNPHNLIVLETQSETGELLTIEIEGGGPSVLQTLGVTVSSIVAGERVTAIVNPSRRFPNRSASGVEVVKANGTVVPLGPRSRLVESQATQETASSIFGTWVPNWESFQGLIRSRASWEFTEAGQGAYDNYTPAESSQAHCIPVSAPWLMVGVTTHEVRQVEDLIIIRTDWLGGVERTVYLDGREHPPDSERYQQGHSVGQWENGILVVDTTNFSDQIYAGVLSGAGKHLIERWSLRPDGKSVSYSFLLEDPEFLVEPVAETYQWNYRPDLEASGVECDIELAERYLREIR